MIYAAVMLLASYLNHFLDFTPLTMSYINKYGAVDRLIAYMFDLVGILYGTV
jgi:hypothetical protein